MSASGVYLVSSKEVGNDGPGVYDNRGFTDVKGDHVTYDASGVSLPEHKQIATEPYRGMGKEDLLRFSSTPFWRRLRLACMAVVILGWVALIFTVVGLVLAYPKCRDAAARSWWQTEVMYRIYVPSFKDSDGDGYGDLKGIETKLDYLQDQGIGIISLSPVYPTSGADFAIGNEAAITNHTSLDLLYGDMADFDSLVLAVHEKGMFLVMDFLPSQTSIDHPWFLESNTSSSRTDAKRNYYVWEAGTTTPNNWKSVFNGSAWTVSSGARGQFYYHHGTSDTPDLNLRSAQVQQELEAILTFWLDHGVDGFNVRDATFLYEDFDLRDDPVKAGSTPNEDYASYNHTYTTNQPEVYSILARWRQVLSEHSESVEKLLITGIRDLDISRLYGDCAKTGVQMPLNDRFSDVSGSCDGDCIAVYVDGWVADTPTGEWFNWMAGDEMAHRLGSRFNSTYAKGFYTLAMLLPGTPVLYYGDEISMVDGDAASASPWKRDQAMRTIMQWENATYAGFSDCNTSCTAPWTAVNDDFKTDNVMTQSSTSGSLLKLLKELATLRQEPSFKVGEYFPALRDKAIFSFVREFDGETGYLVAINLGPNSETRDYTGSHDTIEDEAVVSFVFGSGFSMDDEVDPSDLTLGPYGGVVVSWDYVAKEL